MTTQAIGFINMTIKIMPSSSGFCFNGNVLADTPSQCFRFILLSSHGIRGKFPKLIADIGDFNERRYESEIIPTLGLKSYEREKVLKGPLRDDVTFSGRVDFYENYGDRELATELKSVTSKNTRLSLMRKGQIKAGYLAQITSYMVYLKQTMAKLRATYYELDIPKSMEKDLDIEQKLKDSPLDFLQPQEDVQFKIRIEDDGSIWTKSEYLLPEGGGKVKHANFSTEPKDTQFTVGDLLEHQNLVAEYLREQTIGSRPVDSGFSSACNLCVFKNTCDKYDAGDIKDLTEFKESAKVDVTNSQPRDVKIELTSKAKKVLKRQAKEKSNV